MAKYKIKIFEMFSGYGGASFGLKKANISFKSIGISEIDKYAIQCYNQNFPNIKNYGDCKNINPQELPDFDLLSGGFPCQAFSVAGKRKGELDPRGTLFYDIIRIAEIKQPKYILLENVKGLTNKTFKETFNKILSELKRIGYDVIWKILNTKDYGIPQNRERVFFICKLGKWDFNEFQFPSSEELTIFIKDILEKDVNEKYNLSEKQIKAIKERLNFKGGIINGSISPSLLSRDYKDGGKRVKIDRIQFDISGKGYNSQQDRIYNIEGIMASLPNANPSNKLNIFSLFPRNGNPKQGGTGQLIKSDGTSYNIDTGNAQAILLIDPKTKKEYKEISPTLRSGIGSGNKFQVMNTLTEAQGRQGSSSEFLRVSEKVSINSYMFRRLTPKECFRLMGFLNDEINLQGLSDTQCYKLAGNGWDINLVSKIFKQLLNNTENGIPPKPKDLGILPTII